MALTGLKLRCDLSQCETAVITAPSGGVTSGDIVLNGDLPVIVMNTVDAGEEVAVIVKAEKILVPCAAATTGALHDGAVVYADIADNEVNESSSGNHKCGYVLEAASVGDETVLISFDGTLAL